MILIFYLFHFINSEFIKNYKYPSCRNCIHFIPHLIDNKNKYTTIFDKNI